MTNKVSKEFLQVHFRKYDSITLYTPEGTPVTFRKQNNIVLHGGYHKYTFKDYDALMDFYHKRHLCLQPVITV